MKTPRNPIATALTATLAGLLTAPALTALADDCHSVTGATAQVCTRTAVYAQPSRDHRQELDIYYRGDNRAAPVVVFVPGGAWKQGDKEGYAALADSLAGLHGLTTVVVNYRLSGEDAPAIKHPAHVKDLAAAFSWVKRNIASYGDASRVYLFGQSAGAHLASLLATDARYLAAVSCSASPARACTPADIRGVVSMSGAYDLPTLADAPNEPGLDGAQAAAMDLMYRNMLRNAFGPSPAVWQDASPLAHINPDQPPFLLIGTFDDLPRFASQAHAFSVAIDEMLRGGGSAQGSGAAREPSTGDPAKDPVLAQTPADLQPIGQASAQTPAGARIALRRIERIDYSPEVWDEANCLAASGEPADGTPCVPTDEPMPGALFTGHYAEVVAINPEEPDSYPTRLVADFVATH